MKEIRRPPPLPAVKGTIGAIGTSLRSLESFFGRTWLTDRITFKKIILLRITNFYRESIPKSELMVGPRKSFKGT